MKTRSVAAAILLAVLPQIVPLPALAQAPPDDPVTTQARARFKEGVDFYDRGQYENARLAFLQAYALKKHPAVLLNLAQSSAKSGHHLEAAKYFEQYLHEATTATTEQRKDAENGLADVRQKLGRIEIIGPAGTDVTLDDKEHLGVTPFPDPIDVDPGTHVLKSSTETVKVTANAGQKVQARFAQAGGLAPPIVAPPVTTTPPVDTAAPPNNPPPNNAPNADTGTKHQAGLFSPPETMIPVYVGLGVGVVGLAGAIVFAAFKGSAQSKADDVASQIRTAAKGRSQGICSQTDTQDVTQFGSACQTLQDDNDQVDTDATVANVSLVVMGIGFVAAAGWYLFAPKRDDAKSGKLTFTPYGGYRSGGMTLGGSF